MYGTLMAFCILSLHGLLSPGIQWPPSRNTPIFFLFLKLFLCCCLQWQTEKYQTNWRIWDYWNQCAMDSYSRFKCAVSFCQLKKKRESLQKHSVCTVCIEAIIFIKKKKTLGHPPAFVLAFIKEVSWWRASWDRCLFSPSSLETGQLDVWTQDPLWITNIWMFAYDPSPCISYM